MSKLLNYVIKFIGFFISSVALTTLIIVTIQTFVPAFLSNMFLGDQNSHYPLTFQVVMWLPFSMGMVGLILRAFQFMQNRKDAINPKLIFNEINISKIESLSSAINTLKNISKSPRRVYIFLAVNSLEGIIESSRYGDIKNDIETSSEYIFSKLDSDYARLRYLSWLLPTMGFMGTVYGISAAVSTFGGLSPDDPSILSKVAGTLSIAFDTTLVSLVQASILVFFITFLESVETEFISENSAKILEKSRKIMRQIGTERPLVREKAG